MTDDYCATKHPDYPDLACILRKSERGHPIHLAMRYQPGRSAPEKLQWPNPDYRSPADIKEQARQASLTIEKGADQVRRDLVATDPKKVTYGKQWKKTRLGQVANMLVNNVGVWIDGYRFENHVTGGSSGLRRLRELRDDYGWNIIQQPVKDSTDRYMLVELPDEFKD